MEELDIWHECAVTYVDHMGSDDRVVQAAKVSTAGEASLGAKGTEGFLRFLLREDPAHISPFEHCVATFLIECPLFVAAQLHTHTSFSFNQESGRYREFRPRFYLPDAERPLVQVGKTGDYTFEDASTEMWEYTYGVSLAATRFAWEQYRRLLDAGVAKEVARAVLPQNTITSLYMTGNLRNWIFFLKGRLDTHAQWEIRDVASKILHPLHGAFPITLNVAMDLGILPEVELA